MKNINKSTIIISLATLVVGLGLGWLLFSNGNKEAPIEHQQATENMTSEWTCSMHPHVRQNEPGDCPICGMELIPVGTDSEGDKNPREIKMSPTAMQLASVQTAIVAKKKPIKELRLSGKVQLDESTITSQTTHISGRIEKLLVNTTGEYVKKGQVIAFIYAPELVTAQKELIEAQKIASTSPQLFSAAKEKLKNWKLTDKQINAILTSGKTSENFPILSESNGIVLNKRVKKGDYVKQGTSLFEIANLSEVWILFDVYESNIPWIKLGDKIEFTVQSLPGKEFTGKVSFIDPIINPKTRVAQARVKVVNKGLELKPEMFVSGILNSLPKNEKEEIIIPKSAVMWTGKKSVVYIKSSDANGIGFVMRKIITGASLGDSIVVIEGLVEGEEIATNGTFSIDAAAQLAGKPSMMNPSADGGVVMAGHNHGGNTTPNNSELQNYSKSIAVSMDVKQAIQPLFQSYLAIKNALVSDGFEKSIEEGRQYKSILNDINMSIFKGEAHNVWMRHGSVAKKSIYALTNSEDIETVRNHFVTLSNQMVMLAKIFDPTERTLYIQHCPMANQDNGADWISIEQEIKNPYFGASMLKCGEVKEELK